MSGSRVALPDVVTLLAIALRRLKEELDAALRTGGFTDVRPAHGYAFSRLSFGGATAVQLAEHLGITKQSAGQIVDELQQLGYVRREPHPTDGRGKLIVLTDRGWACVRAAEHAMAGIEARLAERLGVSSLESLRAALATVAADPNPPTTWHGVRPPW